jgi:hypothetical protein
MQKQKIFIGNYEAMPKTIDPMTQYWVTGVPKNMDYKLDNVIQIDTPYCGFAASFGYILFMVTHKLSPDWELDIEIHHVNKTYWNGLIIRRKPYVPQRRKSF